jgi:hypothetical protein
VEGFGQIMAAALRRPGSGYGAGRRNLTFASYSVLINMLG